MAGLLTLSTIAIAAPLWLAVVLLHRIACALEKDKS